MSVPIVAAPPQDLNQIAINRRNQILSNIGVYGRAVGRGAMKVGKSAAKFLVPHGVYKLGKKAKRQVKRVRETWRNVRKNARTEWNNQGAYMTGGAVIGPDGRIGAMI